MSKIGDFFSGFIPGLREIKLSRKLIVPGLIVAVVALLLLLGRCSAPSDKSGQKVTNAVADSTRGVLENKISTDDTAATEQNVDDAQLRAKEKGLDDAINHPGACAPPAAWQRHACEQLRQAAVGGDQAGLPAVCGCAGGGDPGAGPQP